MTAITILAIVSSVTYLAISWLESAVMHQRSLELALAGEKCAERARFFEDQSGFAPENFTTFAHFSVSSAMSFPN